MSINRESGFPSTSIGRSSGSRITQQTSTAHDTHPLLAPGPASPASEASGSTSPNTGPKYVPYTPRQRVTPTAATTGTTVHPASPQQQGDATSKLQLMHLKAAAQGIGLDSGTLGWSILEKLVNDDGEEWQEVWAAITAGKATLLLPLESAFTHEKLTPEFMKDHVVLCDSASRKHAPIVTLSGLRGTLDEETLTFRSSINTTSKLFQDLQSPITRTAALALLPDLPNPTLPYPEFNVPSYSSSLHFPARSSTSSKPPLPPRPQARPGAPAASTSRISLPFASLFGQAKVAAPVPSSPPASIRSFDSSSQDVAAEVCAFTIDRRIVRRDVAKEVNKTLKAEVKAALEATSASALGHVPVPGWVVDRVHDITADWYPFIKQTPPLRKRKLNEKETSGSGYVVNAYEENAGDAAERLQDFYFALEQDMRAGGTPFISKRKDKDAESEAEDEKVRDKREHDRMGGETRIRDVMEVVESTITSLFYDRLFRQPSTDDASHDEALSNRVAALNMLDLGLGHLGIDTGEVNESELDAVVKACGDMLTGLDTCRAPRDKAALLVAAHKIIVDGLSRLPPIRLISENDINDDGDLQTAKPTFNAEGKLNPQPAPSQPDSVKPSEAIPDAYRTSPLRQTVTLENDHATTDADSASISSQSAKVKSPPPPLLLEPVGPSRIEVKSAPKEPTPVSGDVLLPMIIFSVVKSNPPHLVSNLLYTQRFRNQSIGGEESYCLINLLAVAEFLENVDMTSLGLGDSSKVMSTADLSPIPLARSPATMETPLEPDTSGIRGRVGQQVDAITDSANKVISGVVDSSFGILRSFMPTQSSALDTSEAPGSPGAPYGTRAGFGLLRRESGFSIASIAASLPIAGRSRSNTGAEESGQQLVTVSRPGSRASRASLRIKVAGADSDEEGSSASESSAMEGEEEESEGEEGEDEDGEDDGAAHSVNNDTRSIRSFESMMNAGKEKSSRGARARKSLSDRLASVSALASNLKGTDSGSRRTSLLQPNPMPHRGSPSSSRAGSPSLQLRLGPPKQRFLECSADDLRLSEVSELLREYRRLVEGIRAVDGFDE
ncbi:hypothetical protein D9619_006641 [Psilocybe cf. subviscida]|uniref:VPS9 domain-containing protein n=1 Tax=Psilocybe cf. subviscida TaxID=2480587 RepID=A0A8H5B5R7_9AGAR|nr:hypothetical protein D9619_006641 [Psilocybe cf. subviscida]